jgi:hypothetical protein
MTKRDQYYVFIKPMKRHVSNLEHSDEDADTEWQEKARRLQARRWHQLRNEIKGVYSHYGYK